MAVIYIAPTRLDAACTFARVLQTAETLLQNELNTTGPVALMGELQSAKAEDSYLPVALDQPFVWRKPTQELLWVDVAVPENDPFSLMLRCEQFSSGEISISDVEAGCGRTMNPSERQDMKKANTYWSMVLPNSASPLEARAHHLLARAIADVCEGWVYVG